MTNPIEQQATKAVGGQTGLEPAGAHAVPVPADSALLARPAGGTVTQSRVNVPAGFSQAAVDQLLAPYVISLDDWLRGILTTDEYPEEDPNDATRAMIAQILLAQSSEEALAGFDLDRAKEMCGGEPGGRSNVLEIRGARPIRSEYEQGAACYVIVDAFDLAEQQPVKFTTGARGVQAVILAHMANEWMPFKACLEIRRERTRAGFYPLNLVAGI